MTDKEKAIVMAYTGICMLSGDKFQIFHKYVEEIMDRPVYTHEMAIKAIDNDIKEKAKADFIALCAEQEPCDDWYDIPSDEMTLEQARQAVKVLRKKLIEHLKQGPKYWIDKDNRIYKMTNDIPSVSQKVGKWKVTPMSKISYCSICDELIKNIPSSIVTQFKYCPNCGAKMAVPQEGGVKE